MNLVVATGKKDEVGINACLVTKMVVQKRTLFLWRKKI